jgi:hypothetical protein
VAIQLARKALSEPRNGESPPGGDSYGNRPAPADNA